MAAEIHKGLKRRWHAGGGQATDWQQSYSGFDEEIIESEKNQGPPKIGKGKRKTDCKLPSRKTTISDEMLSVEKDFDIDWESSSSKDPYPGSPSLPLLDDTVINVLPQGTQWVSTSLKPASIGEVPPFRKLLKVKEIDLRIEDGGGSQCRSAAEDVQVDEANISDYESSEPPSPSAETPEGQTSPASVVMATQSPPISSYGQSTQDTVNESPPTSSQWVDKIRRGQQSTPEKGTSRDGPRPADQMEEKDSARKNIKFKSSGLAERLKKLISREKSDIAFWHHQSSSQLAAGSGTECGVQIVDMFTDHGLVIARCHNASGCSDVDTNIPDLPKDLMVLFNSKTVQDKAIQVGATVQIYPPWQKLFLPGSSQTILLCTYYCESAGKECPDTISPTSSTTSRKIEAPEPVFRPSRLFGGDHTSPRSSYNAAIPPHSRSPPLATSLLDILAAKGPSFYFTFSLRVLVLRVCKMVSARSNLEEQKWRMLVQDQDRTVFEVQLTSVKDMKRWEGRVVAVDRLRISQRITRMRNPDLFSMIDSYHRSPSKVTTSPIQSISYIVRLEGPKKLSEDEDDFCMQPFSNIPHKDLTLVKLQDELHRVSFHGLLLHATPKEVTNPLTSSSSQGTQLLFITDPSLSGKAVKRDISEKIYVLVEKPPSCPVGSASHVSDLQQLQGSLLHLELVHVKEGALLLDCYSSVSIVQSECVPDADAVNNPGFTAKDCLPIYPQLTQDSAENTLVTVTGTLTGVDESTAYSWPVCGACLSSHLRGCSSGDKLHCLSCDTDVLSPVTRIHLQALVECLGLDGTHSIKVKLKQAAVTDFFGMPPSEEPFDLKKMIGKPYGPTACLVRRSGHTDTAHRDIELEEI